MVPAQFVTMTQFVAQTVVLVRHFCPQGALSEDDHLWQRTCFEAFVSVKGHPAYFMAKNVHAMRDSRAPYFLLFTPLPPSSVTL